MTHSIFTSHVEFDANNGQVVITNTEARNDLNLLTKLKQYFEKKCAGRMYLNKESDLIFEPYNRGANPSTVQTKETIGMSIVTRSPKMVKFSLSLPATMSRHQMIMALYDQCTLLTEALKSGGLYERLVKREQAEVMPAA
jgi:hypothetical protein